MKFYIYRDAHKEWRWKLFAKNGRIIADSAEGYRRKSGIQNALSLVMACGDAPMEWEGEGKGQ